VRHGAGYTIFEHNSHGLKQQLRLFAAPNAPVKIVQLRLQNLTKRPRRITATYYAEWVLGADRNTTQAFIIPGYHSEYQALTARNPYSMDFGEAVAFLAADREPHGFTTDRAEFIGRLGHLSQPAALERIGLTNAVSVGADPCAAIQLHLDLEPGESEVLYFILGQGQDEAEALTIIEEFRNAARVTAAWREVQELWDDILGTVTVETPDPAMNILLNRWLLYQALSCRVWGRSAL
jgi:cyclic beta-1,2-glucan synthetase